VLFEDEEPALGTGDPQCVFDDQSEQRLEILLLHELPVDVQQ